MENHLFPYKWKLEDSFPAKGIFHHRSKVFSCFACGGGSSMGYKLAGYDVIGCNEVDPKVIEIYKENLHPKYAFTEAIQTFKLRKDLPKRLYELDILDGSPPCSSFSMSGNREKDWGKEKVFKEGQIKQVLDTLFFDFIDLANELQPKIVVAENVKGILLGAAHNRRTHIKDRIYKAFDKAGYICQHWLLDASKMGVPQRRERVFFIALRKDLAEPFLVKKGLFEVVPKLELKFNEPPIKFKEFRSEIGIQSTKKVSNLVLQHFQKGDTHVSDIAKRELKKNNYGFNISIIEDNSVLPTIDATNDMYRAFDRLQFSMSDLINGSTFPQDYKNVSQWLMGMSVPPTMMAQIANQIYLQWLSKID